VSWHSASTLLPEISTFKFRRIARAHWQRGLSAHERASLELVVPCSTRLPLMVSESEPDFGRVINVTCLTYSSFNEAAFLGWALLC
jgi:hypothetical protein